MYIFRLTTGSESNRLTLLYTQVLACSVFKICSCRVSLFLHFPFKPSHTFEDLLSPHHRSEEAGHTACVA